MPVLRKPETIAVASEPWSTTSGNCVATLKNVLPEEGAQDFHKLVRRAAVSAANNEAVADFADAIGSRNGISGYSYHTVPCVLQVWFGNAEDFAEGLQDIIKTGGDTDTAGAIYGGIVGSVYEFDNHQHLIPGRKKIA